MRGFIVCGMWEGYFCRELKSRVDSNNVVDTRSILVEIAAMVGSINSRKAAMIPTGVASSMVRTPTCSEVTVARIHFEGSK